MRMEARGDSTVCKATNLMATAGGITAGVPGWRLPAVPPEGAGPEQILLRGPPQCHRPFRAGLAGGMPRLHHRSGNGGAVVLGPLRRVLGKLSIEIA